MIYLIYLILGSYLAMTVIVGVRTWQLRTGRLGLEELKRPTISKMLLKTMESLGVFLWNISKTGYRHILIYSFKILKIFLSFSRLQVGKIERSLNSFLGRRFGYGMGDKGFLTSLIGEINLHHKKVKKDLEKVYSRH